jgi:PncC family amidohydrolase
MIGSHLTAVPGASKVYKGGVVSYVDEVKAHVLNVPEQFLEKYGAVSAPVAEYMARGVRRLMQTDYALAVTGLAGPGGDDFGHEVGTVFIAVDHAKGAKIRQFLRRQFIAAVPVQNPKNRSRIGAATSHAGTGRDVLHHPDRNSVRFKAHSITIESGRLPGKVPFITGNILPTAGELPGFTGSNIHLNHIIQGYGLHHAFQIMIAVFPFSQNIQRQIQFCPGFFSQCHHKYSTPFLYYIG